MTATRRWDTAILLLLVCAALFEWISFEREPGLAVDSAYMMGLAKSLALNGSYIFNFTPHTRFPLGTPLILAGIGRFFGFEWPVLVRAGAVCGVLGACVAWRLFRRMEDPTCAAAGVALLLSSSTFFVLSTQAVSSDLPYLLVSFAVLGLVRWWEDSVLPNHRLLGAVAITLLLPFSVLVRSAGMALLAGFVGWMFLSRVRVRYFAAAALLSLVVQGSWALWQRRVEVLEYPGQYMHTYVDQALLRDPHRPSLGRVSIADLPARVASGLIAQAAAFSQTIIPIIWLNPLWYSPAIAVPIALTAAGLWSSVTRRRPGLAECYFAAYVGLFAFWPYTDDGERYLLPVFPLAFLYLWRGLSLSAIWIAERRRALSTAIFAGSFLIVLITPHWSELPGKQGQLSVLFWGLVGCLAAWAAWRSVPAAWAAAVPSRLRLAALSMVVLLTARGFVQETRIARDNLDSRAESKGHHVSISAAKWFRQFAPSDAVLLADANLVPVVHFLTGRRTVTFPVTTDADFLRSVIEDHQVRFVLVDLGTWSYFYPTQRERVESLRARFPALLRVVHEGHDYQILQAGEWQPSGGGGAPASTGRLSARPPSSGA